MIKIYFDSLPSCAPCRTLKPPIEAAANQTGAQFILRNEQSQHGNQTTTLPTIYIQKNNEPPVMLSNIPSRSSMIDLIKQLKGEEAGTNEKPSDTPDTKTPQKKILKLTGIILLILIIIFTLRKKKIINIKM